jgi:predicted enzyme related to lactoylglutathione lyase
MAKLIVNVDVPELDPAVRFYTAAFDLRVGRRSTGGGIELVGAEAAGATVEKPVERHSYGKLAVLADPWGNGFCFVQFEGRGYDEIATGMG